MKNKKTMALWYSIFHSTCTVFAHGTEYTGVQSTGHAGYNGAHP